MASLYTPEARAIFNSKPWPVGLKMEVVEGENNLWLRLYRENINQLSHDEKMRMAGMLNDALTRINNLGIPARTWVEAGHGPVPTQGG